MGFGTAITGLIQKWNMSFLQPYLTTILQGLRSKVLEQTAAVEASVAGGFRLPTALSIGAVVVVGGPPAVVDPAEGSMPGRV